MGLGFERERLKAPSLFCPITVPRLPGCAVAGGEIVHAKLKNRAGVFVPRPVNYIPAFCEACDALSSFKFPPQHFDARESKP